MSSAKRESASTFFKGGRGRNYNGGDTSSKPEYTSSAATVKKHIPAVDGATPYYVTSIKATKRDKKSSPEGAPKAASSATVAAIKTVATTHAQSSKELRFDSTTLGILDPAYFTRVFTEGFISVQGWEYLRAGYRYTGIDHSFCGNRFLYLWWNFVVERIVPLWMAPNLLTLLGFFCNFGAYLLVVATTDNMAGPAPPYVWALVGISIFAYQTFDSIDGRQARKTNTASPLGELFDHGAPANDD